LLFDEDLCATNFMIRDDVMRKLVKLEPITPLIERVDAQNRECAKADTRTSFFAGCFFDLGRWWLFRLSHRRLSHNDGKLPSEVRPRP
jgi:hypothetical protein